ncbi:hypothetical protein H5410_060968 [Solanum commersonii]|uniref:Uncharacterized protein n=1 Tax=Solanum commersonii TaxID=4109 RepID=A0A9J5W6N7_SOLCO|nr:hypothetical protein H5410_060968 [Solanum commersonii]
MLHPLNFIEEKNSQLHHGSIELEPFDIDVGTVAGAPTCLASVSPATITLLELAKDEDKEEWVIRLGWLD